MSISRRSLSRITAGTGVALLFRPLVVTGQSENPLSGRWIGYRPTNGYVWEIRYQLDFDDNGRYSYQARQVSTKKPFWRIEHKGQYRLLGSDSPRWRAILQLIPDNGSAPPPTEDDRTALVDLLGLPDDKPRKF